MSIRGEKFAIVKSLVEIVAFDFFAVLNGSTLDVYVVYQTLGYVRVVNISILLYLGSSLVLVFFDHYFFA